MFGVCVCAVCQEDLIYTQSNVSITMSFITLCVSVGPHLYVRE